MRVSQGIAAAACPEHVVLPSDGEKPGLAAGGLGAGTLGI